MNVLFFDTESTDLSASWGRILCASFIGLEDGAKPYTLRYDELKRRNQIDDSELVVKIRDELEASDICVGWNSKLHDIPLLNARLALAGERPCLLGKDHGTHHLDLMWYSGGSSMKIGGKRLETVSRYFKTEDNKTPLDGETWQLAAVGDRAAMDQVVEHCEFDVVVLRELWPHLAPYVKQIQLPLASWYHVAEHIPNGRR